MRGWATQPLLETSSANACSAALETRFILWQEYTRNHSIKSFNDSIHDKNRTPQTTTKREQTPQDSTKHHQTQHNMTCKLLPSCPHTRTSACFKYKRLLCGLDYEPTAEIHEVLTRRSLVPRAMRSHLLDFLPAGPRG